MKKTIFFILLILTVTLSFNCSAHRGMGIGPVTTVMNIHDELNTDLVDKGRESFRLKCAECHSFNSSLKGPILHRVTERRRPEWIMNMILNPVQMVKTDPYAKELLIVYSITMISPVTDVQEARELLEYIRYMDENYDNIAGNNTINK